MKIVFYPYDFDYCYLDGRTFLNLYSRTKEGEKIAVKVKHDPYFYADTEGVDTDRLKDNLKGMKIMDVEVLGWEEVEKELVGRRKKFWKVYVNYPKGVPIISKKLGEWNIHTYEKDILYVHRSLRDLGITPFAGLGAEGKLEGEMKSGIKVFRAESIVHENHEKEQAKKKKGSEEIKPEAPEWKMLALDIETYSPQKEINPYIYPVLMVALQGKGFKKVLTWKQFDHGLDHVEFVKDEKEMLIRLGELIKEFSPEILLGYFSDGFDLPYLKIRAEKLGVKLDWGIDSEELFAGTKSDFREGESKITGMLHLDLLKFVRNIFGRNLKTESHALDLVANELLGCKKHPIDIGQLAEVWDSAEKKSKEMEEYCKYNLQDAELTYKLGQLLFFDIEEFVKLLGIPPYDLIRMKFSRLVESYILKRAIEFKVVAPNKPTDYEIEQRMRESIQGAFVFEPKPAVYNEIVVFDFRSLYPTIITAHNLSPESFRREGCRKKENVPGKEEYWFCLDKKSFLSTILEELIVRRGEIKKQLKTEKSGSVLEEKKMLESRSSALKLLGNSFYGYLGFYGARWYSLESAASTTAYARDYIKRTIGKAEEEGFEVIYADTDSCFVTLAGKKLGDALKFKDLINEDLPGMMELEMEGYFSRGIFVGVKGSAVEKGAKKKYALIREDGTMKIAGFETVRRNWSPLAKEVQKEVLKLVLTGKSEEALAYVKETGKKLRTGKVKLKKLIMKTQLTRELSQYSAVGPHVKIAQRLVEKGKRVVPGMVVEYVIEKGSGLIRDRAKLVEEIKEGDYDADYYVNNQLIPAVEGIFAVLGYTDKDLLSGSKQEGLGKFFS
jgi:DNA polymerase I